MKNIIYITLISLITINISYGQIYVVGGDVGIGDSTPASKLEVAGTNTTGETVDLRTTGVLVANADLLNLQVGTGSSATSQIIEATNGGVVFTLNGNGKLSILKGSNGPAFRY